MVSVIISVWNGENYLGEAIESVLRQDYAEKEVILVNDGSTDQTKSIIKSFGSRVLCIDQENKGLGAGRNTGIRRASGDYFTFLDHDDLWVPNKLSMQMKELLSANDTPLIFTHVKQFICPTLPEEERRKIHVDASPLPGYIAGTMLLSRQRFQEIGYFSEQKKQLGEFIEWYLKILELKIPVKMLSEIGL